MKLQLQDAVRKNEYYFTGYTDMSEIADLFREYPFEEETLERAAIHRKNMENGIRPFSLLLRGMPDTKFEIDQSNVFFDDVSWEIRDGKSRVAAIKDIEKDFLTGYEIEVTVILATPEKMNAIENN